jgi:GGDEF domain-containing protein
MVALAATVDIVRHLRRLERASSAADIVKELQYLTPSLGRPRFLPTTDLPVLAALAESHMRDRLEPARDALTGLHDARAFTELFQAHARNVATSGGEAIAVTLTLLDVADPRGDREVAAYLRMLAAACTTSVAENDYVGRVAPATLAVLPRHGGLRGAQSVAARLQDCCREVFGAASEPLRIEVALKDASGQIREQTELAVGPQDLA